MLIVLLYGTLAAIAAYSSLSALADARWLAFNARHQTAAHAAQRYAAEAKFARERAFGRACLTVVLSAVAASPLMMCD